MCWTVSIWIETPEGCGDDEQRALWERLGRLKEIYSVVDSVLRNLWTQPGKSRSARLISPSIWSLHLHSSVTSPPLTARPRRRRRSVYASCSQSRSHCLSCACRCPWCRYKLFQNEWWHRKTVMRKSEKMTTKVVIILIDTQQCLIYRNDCEASCC